MIYSVADDGTLTHVANELTGGRNDASGVRANPFPTLPSLFRVDGIGVAQGPRDFAISPCGG